MGFYVLCDFHFSDLVHTANHEIEEATESITRYKKIEKEVRKLEVMVIIHHPILVIH